MDDLDVGVARSTQRRKKVQKKAAAEKKAKPKAKKKRVGSSAKGFGFERKLSVIFSEWWTEGERDDVFWRTEGSGSRATSRAKRGKMTRFQYGDMTFTDPIGQPMIEAINFEFKNYKTYDLLSAFTQTDPNKSWLVFWAETRVDAALSGRTPVLITKKNQHKMIMWMPRALFNALYSFGFHPYPRMLVELKEQTVRMKKGKSVDIPQHCVVGVLFDEFLEAVDPRMFEELLYATGCAKRAGDAAVRRSDAEEAAGSIGEETNSSSGGSSSTS